MNEANPIGNVYDFNEMMQSHRFQNNDDNDDWREIEQMFLENWTECEQIWSERKEEY